MTTKKITFGIMLAIIIIAPAMAYNFDEDKVEVTVITGNFTNITQAGDVAPNAPISSIFDNNVLTWSDAQQKFILQSLTQNRFWNRTGTNLFMANPGDFMGIGTSSPSHELNVLGTGNFTGNIYGSTVFASILNASGTSNLADATFNGGWENGGVSIIDGDIYAQVGFFVNITALGVDELHINGSFLPNITGVFDLGSADLLWNDLFLAGQIFSNGTNDNYFLGNVGIGTSSPAEKLHVKSTTDNVPSFIIEKNAGHDKDGIRLRNTYHSSQFDIFFQRESTDAISGLYIDYNNNDVDSVLSTTGAEMFIGINGNVGIGVTDPETNLEIKGSKNTSPLIISSADANVDTDYIGLDLRIGAVANRVGRIVAVTETDNDDIGLAFYTTNNGATPEERIRIDHLGNVGIGTSSPDFKLQVNGSIAPEETAVSSFGSSILRWLKGWFVDLDISNNLSVGGNATISGTLINPDFFIPQYVFSHNDATLPVVGASVWTNLTFSQEESTIKQGIGHTFNDNSNITFTFNSDGVYEVFFDYDMIDFSAGASDVDVAGRVIYTNGTEILGSVFETDIVKQEVEGEVTHSFLMNAIIGDGITFQFISQDEDVSVSTHGTFGDHPDSATITIKKIGN